MRAHVAYIKLCHVGGGVRFCVVSAAWVVGGVYQKKCVTASVNLSVCAD